MYEVIEKENVKIENLIYEIRGYGEKNKEKFPDDFYFQLTLKEFNNLKSQIGTSNSKRYGGVRKLPYVFTEVGVSMLSTVIHTDVATQTTINIMRAFVTMRHFIIDNKDIYKSLNILINIFILLFYLN